MKIVKLTDTLGVSGQISPEDVADIAAAGYKVLINNRPDGEEGTQPSGAATAPFSEVTVVVSAVSSTSSTAPLSWSRKLRRQAADPTTTSTPT